LDVSRAVMVWAGGQGRQEHAEWRAAAVGDALAVLSEDHALDLRAPGAEAVVQFAAGSRDSVGAGDPSRALAGCNGAAAGRRRLYEGPGAAEALAKLEHCAPVGLLPAVRSA